MRVCMLPWMLLASSLASAVMGARILGVFPFPARSHVVIYSTIMKELAARGHEVTMFSSYHLDDPTANYTNLKLDINLSTLLGMNGTRNMFTMGSMKGIASIFIFNVIGETIARHVFQQKNIQDFISAKDKKFDVIFLSDISTEALAGFAHKYDSPIIYLSPTTGFPWTNELIGNPSPDSYVSSIFSQYTDHMTFGERLENTVYNTLNRLSYHLYRIPKQDRLMREYFQDIDDLPHLYEISRRTALIFTCAVPGINYPKPLLPNIIQIGGIHLKPAKPLPSDLKKYLDDATEGVIYFSLGSNLRSADLPEDTIAAFMNTFSKLKQKVLWKFEEENLPGQPSNLKISKWFPQNDILAHQNVILFITHGGMLSTQEAIYHGMPIVGIPVFGDQDYNINIIEKIGCGLKLKLSDINGASVERAVKELITNPSYRERAKEASRIFRDQLQSPMEKAVFWTEYVLRHKGASHLRSAAMDLSWYQYFLLDVIAVLVLVPAILVYCVLLLCRILFCAKKKISVSDIKKKN